MITRSKALCRFAALMSLDFVVGCGCLTTRCVDGIRVSLSQVPAAPFKIELIVDGVVQADSRTCDAGQTCGPIFFFSNSNFQSDVAVRVTTPAGVRTTDVGRVSYRAEKLDPSYCEACQIANVTAPVP